MQNRLHCGACQKEVSEEDFNNHRVNCPAVKCLLVPSTMLMLGAKDLAHQAANLVFNIPYATAYIEEYAESISNEISSWDRAVIHKRLCSKLRIDYNDFKPFESEDILEIPSKQDAIEIIYDFLKKKILSYLQ